MRRDCSRLARIESLTPACSRVIGSLFDKGRRPRRWHPWERSTGPKTAAGKAIVARHFAWATDHFSSFYSISNLPYVRYFKFEALEILRFEYHLGIHLEVVGSTRFPTVFKSNRSQAREETYGLGNTRCLRLSSQHQRPSYLVGELADVAAIKLDPAACVYAEAHVRVQ